MEEVYKQIKEKCPIFYYNKPQFPSDCEICISPSKLPTFFSHPSEWYGTTLGKQSSTFQGNTSSCIGTIVHHILECVTKNQTITKESINEELITYHSLKPNPDIDIQEVMSIYPFVAEAVVNDWLLNRNKLRKNIKIEDQVIVPIKEGIYIGGTCDRFEFDKTSGTVIDFKNVGKKPDTEELPLNYILQLMSYVYIYRQLGHTVNEIGIVYGVRPTKTLPARCYEVIKPIIPEYEEYFNNCLQLVIDSVIAIRNQPNLAYLIFKDINLK